MLRVDLSGLADAPWVGLPLGTPEAPGLHLPAFSASAIAVATSAADQPIIRRSIASVNSSP